MNIEAAGFLDLHCVVGWANDVARSQEHSGKTLGASKSVREEKNQPELELMHNQNKVNSGNEEQVFEAACYTDQVPWHCFLCMPTRRGVDRSVSRKGVPLELDVSVGTASGRIGVSSASSVWLGMLLRCLKGTLRLGLIKKGQHKAAPSGTNRPET